MSTVAVADERLQLRLLEPADEPLLRQFYYRLSPETVLRRFMAPVAPPANSLVGRLMNVDHCQREALIAIDREGIAGIARFAPNRDGTSDVAVVVADAWQRKRLGTLLMRRLGHIARARGIDGFHATIQAENRRALLFLRHLWPAASFALVDGVMEANIPLTRK